jgi:subtilisin family serine protease
VGSKFKHHLLASAVISAFSVCGSAESESKQGSLSEQETSRFIVKYKTASLPMMSGTSATRFDLREVSSELQAKGIRVKRELPMQASIAVELSTQLFNELKNDPQVEFIEQDHRRDLMAIYEDTVGDPNTTQLTPYAIVQSQADQLTLQDGQKVCVIDSGIAGTDGETGGLNNDFNWANITGDNDSGTGLWNADGGPHGTHVAGTVGAADNEFGVIGMAPGVSMHIIKVFNNSGWGYSSDLAYAAQKCSDAGANIITMSLGGGGANNTEENAFETFTENGGLVLAAAGNDGNTTRSYPAGYDSVMMIGANDNDNNIASFSQFPSCNDNKTNCVEVTAGGVNTLSTYPSGGAMVVGLTVDDSGYAASSMENSGDASAETFFMGIADQTDAGADGKICVIDRGEITFHDKVKNCEDSGGLGAIIINNVDGMLSGTLGSDNQTTIPAVGTRLEDRNALVSSTNASISIGAGSYGLMSGTSMATPGVAGVAALVWSNHPHCNGTEIRQALKASAEDSGAEGHDVYFGNGIVKAKAASDYIVANGCNAQPSAGSIQFVSNNATVDEDAGSISITIERINGSAGEVSFDIATSNGTATESSDYAAVSQSLLMADGEVSKTISIDIINDSEYEGETAENFFVSLSNPSSNTEIQQPSEMQININEDDPMPPAGDFALSSAEYSVDENAGELTVTVNRVNGDYGEATVEISASDASATNDDYQAINETITFAHGETEQQITVTLIDDSVYEGDESFTVTLANPSDRSSVNDPSVATVTIVEDDPMPPAGDFALSDAEFSIDENAASLTITINRVNGDFGDASVEVSTSGNSATAGSDFEAVNEKVIFAEGETSKQITIALIDDTEYEGDETFSVRLANASERSNISSPATATVTITEDDPEPEDGGSLHWLMLLSLLLLRSRRQAVKQ